MVEDRLIEAALLWRRSPGGGRWPFASDGPWHLVAAELYGPDVDKDAPITPRPLSRAEVGLRDEVSAWLEWIADAHSRRIVALAVDEQARSGQRVQWRRMLRTLGMARGVDGLRKRYDRALAGVVRELERRGVALAA